MATFRRLLGFLRPYRRALIISLALAWMAMAMTVLIPLLSGAAVNAIKDEQRDDILPLVLALLGAGIVRLLLTVGRRLIAGKVATATRYSRRNRPAEQEVQQRIGEVTASAEESISGIRIVKAFARERHVLGRFRHSVNRVFEQSMVSTRLQAFYTPLMGFLPNLGLAAVLLVGGMQVIHGHTNIGHLTAFYLYVVLLSGPVRWLGMSLSMAQRAVASGNRMFEILDREPSMQSPPGAPPLPEGRGP